MLFELYCITNRPIIFLLYSCAILLGLLRVWGNSSLNHLNPQFLCHWIYIRDRVGWHWQSHSPSRSHSQSQWLNNLTTNTIHNHYSTPRLLTDRLIFTDDHLLRITCVIVILRNLSPRSHIAQHAFQRRPNAGNCRGILLGLTLTPRASFNWRHLTSIYKYKTWRAQYDESCNAIQQYKINLHSTIPQRIQTNICLGVWMCALAQENTQDRVLYE